MTKPNKKEQQRRNKIKKITVGDWEDLVDELLHILDIVKLCQSNQSPVSIYPIASPHSPISNICPICKQTVNPNYYHSCGFHPQTTAS